MSATAASLRAQEMAFEAIDFDTVSALTVSKEALADLDSRREYAAYCAALYALEALVDGEPVEAIMKAAGFLDGKASARNDDEDGYDPFTEMLFGHRRRSYDPREAFKAWLHQALNNVIDGTFMQERSS